MPSLKPLFSPCSKLEWYSTTCCLLIFHVLRVTIPIDPHNKPRDFLLLKAFKIRHPLPRWCAWAYIEFQSWSPIALPTISGTLLGLLAALVSISSCVDHFLPQSDVLIDNVSIFVQQGLWPLIPSRKLTYLGPVLKVLGWKANWVPSLRQHCPTPDLEAFASITNFCSKFGKANTSTIVMAFLREVIVSFAVRSHSKPSFLRRWVNGTVIFP